MAQVTSGTLLCTHNPGNLEYLCYSKTTRHGYNIFICIYSIIYILVSLLDDPCDTTTGIATAAEVFCCRDALL